MEKRNFLAAVLMGVVCFSGSAYGASIEIADFDTGHTLLNFDEQSHYTLLDNEYSAQGVTFSGSRLNNGAGSPSNVYIYGSKGSHSHPNYIGQPRSGWVGSIILNFDLGLGVTQVGAVLIEGGTWMTAYDDFGNEIDKVAWGFSGDKYDDFVGIDSAGIGISTVIFSGNFYAVDDVRFNSKAIPEPHTLLLLGFALSVLVYGRKKIMSGSVPKGANPGIKGSKFRFGEPGDSTSNIIH